MLAGSVGCGGPKKPAGTSSDTDGGGGGDGGSEETAGGQKGDGGAEKKDECVGFDVGNVENMLLKSSCEEPGKPDSISPVDLKGKLEVTVSSSPSRVLAGGKADLLVSFSNKSKEPLVLHFKIDPVPRFELEVWDRRHVRDLDERLEARHGELRRPEEAANSPVFSYASLLPKLRGAGRSGCRAR